MIIAINTRFLFSDYLEGFGNFIFETSHRLAKQYPEHQFIFIFDRPFDQRFVSSSNITPVIAGPAARHPILWKYWYDYKIPAVLKKYKADVFVSADGFCSLRTKVPQCLVVHDLAFLHYPTHLRRSHLSFYKKYTPKFLKKAASIATVSEFSKKDIIDQYKIDPEKINVVYNGVKEIFKPLPEGVREEMRNKYTGGKEYFLYTGSVHPRKNLMNLIKAFSMFKKRQKSSFKLLIAGRLAWKYESFVESLKSYKYRDDVVMTGYVDDEELAKITASAWAMVYPSLLEGFGVPVVEAMNCKVPVITSAASAMEEIAGDAALYTDPNSVEDIADKMMRIYKDETLRNELIKKGEETGRRYTWERTAGLMWQSIIFAANKKQ